jgi:hypothetical protein
MATVFSGAALLCTFHLPTQKSNWRLSFAAHPAGGGVVAAIAVVEANRQMKSVDGNRMARPPKCLTAKLYRLAADFGVTSR